MVRLQAVRIRLGSAPELDGTLNIQAMHFLFLLPDGCAGSITSYVKYCTMLRRSRRRGRRTAAYANEHCATLGQMPSALHRL